MSSTRPSLATKPVCRRTPHDQEEGIGIGSGGAGLGSARETICAYIGRHRLVLAALRVARYRGERTGARAGDHEGVVAAGDGSGDHVAEDALVRVLEAGVTECNGEDQRPRLREEGAVIRLFEASGATLYRHLLTSRSYFQFRG